MTNSKNQNESVSANSNLRERINAFAVKNKFVVSEYVDHKIKWSEENENRCFCDPDHRTCPCNHVYEDMVNFNGRCLCNLIWRPEAYETWKFYHNRPKQPQKEMPVMSNEEYKNAKEKVRKVWESLN